MATRNFTDQEFACPCGCGTLPTPEMQARWQALREIYGRSINPTSCIRCEEHNRKVGGAAGSRHVLSNGGDAMDIRVDNALEVADLISAAIEGRKSGKAKIGGIGVNRKSGSKVPGFVHLDFRSGPLLVWSY